MKKIAQGSIAKKIFLVLVITILCNFIAPLYSHADGGVLLDPLKMFVAFIGDVAMSLINLCFTGQWIDVAGAKVEGTGNWKDYWAEGWRKTRLADNNNYT